VFTAAVLAAISVTDFMVAPTCRSCDATGPYQKWIAAPPRRSSGFRKEMSLGVAVLSALRIFLPGHPAVYPFGTNCPIQ
jgi:hypothetical protein